LDNKKHRVAVFQTKKGSVKESNLDYDDGDKENNTLFYPTLQNYDQISDYNKDDNQT
jgi:hypothetical protein